jgi:hypothetical protein
MCTQLLAMPPLPSPARALACAQVFDAEYRKQYPSVTRFFVTCVNQPQFKAVMGEVKLCEQAPPPPAGVRLAVLAFFVCHMLPAVMAACLWSIVARSCLSDSGLVWPWLSACLAWACLC